MEINKQNTPVDGPVTAIDEKYLIEITKRLRESYMGNDAKVILKWAYDQALTRLHDLLNSRNPASWILEAYKQTFMWTMVFREELMPGQHFEAPKELAPVGRYGWRYVIEYLLTRGSLNSVSRAAPDYGEVSEAFTLLSILACSAEWSDLIHFFPDVYGDVWIDLDNEFGLLSPVRDQKAEVALVERAKYMQKRESDAWERYTKSQGKSVEYNVDSVLGLALRDSYGFTVDDVRQVIDCLCKTALSSGFVVILPGPYLIDWVAEEGGINRDIVKKVIEFVLLSSDALKEVDRKFFNKRDPLRMINFAGIKVERLKNLKSIYPKGAVKEPHIKNSNWHVIINVFMVGEWLDVFLHKCSNGQRQDLKSHPVLNKALEDIEQYQRRNVFETVVANIFSECGCKYVKSLKKCLGDGGKLVPLPCGEIDIIAYDSISGVMFVVECKAGAPAIDSRGFSQQKLDHFTQKKYHQKFLSKIEWVNNNLDFIKGLGELASELNGCMPSRVIPVMVTRYPNIVRFYVDDYPVITFAELQETIEMYARDK